MGLKEKNIWHDRKRTIFGLPLSFTRYYLNEEKFMCSSGFLSIKEEEIRLYRVTDITHKRSLWNRIFGVGSIHICSADRTTPEFTIKNVKKSSDLRDKLSNLVEEERNRKNVSAREFFDDDGHC